jgi:NADH dehydrogenase
VAARLSEDGHEVRCLVRAEDDDNSAYLRGLGAGLVVGNILDADSFASSVKGSGAFIHLVGIIFERRNATFKRIHLQGTMNALAAAAVGGAKRFVFMSALGTGPQAQSAYHKSKWQAEEAVRNGGLGYTIFRPSTIYGPGSELFDMLGRQVRLMPVIPVIGNGRYRMQPISVFDVAACFSKCLGNDKAVDRTYELGGPDPLAYNEIIDILCAVMGKKRLKFHAPVALVKPVAWLSERLMSKPLLTTDQLTMLMNDNVCDISAMRDELGVEPVEFKKGLTDMMSAGLR